MIQRNIKALEEKPFDVVVIGGGIFGAAIAWDAALRGLQVALIERGDFCQGASANSFRMVHGGIRYIQHFDIPRIRESVRERRALLRIAPHLIEPLPIAIPTFGHGMKGKGALLAGMRLYEAFAYDRNRGITDPARRIPAGRLLSRPDALRMFPVLEGTRVTGAGVFCDGQIYNPPRLVLAFLQSAVERGAVVANYLEAIGLILQGNRVTGVEARDALSGNTLRILGRVVVNAAGGWTPSLLAERLQRPLHPGATFSRDACFITRRPSTGSHALALLGMTRDPDALLSRDARHLFLVPWRGYTMVGVWHKVFVDHPDRVTVTRKEIQTWIDEVNASCPPLKLDFDEVACYNTGLTLFGDNTPGREDLSYAHRSRLVDHARADQLEGMITAIGVRLTVARGVAEEVLGMVGRKLGRSLPPCRTEVTPLAGGAVPDVERFVESVLAGPLSSLPPDVGRSLARNFGSDYDRVMEPVRRDPSLARRLGNSHVIRAQVVLAVRAEMAQRLSDVVYRRTDLGTAELPDPSALEDCAAVMAGELGWSPDRIADEIAQVRAVFPHPASAASRIAPAQEGMPSGASP